MQEFVKKNKTAIGIVLALLVIYVVFIRPKKASSFAGNQKRGVYKPDKLDGVANFANDEELFMLSKSSLGF